MDRILIESDARLWALTLALAMLAAWRVGWWMGGRLRAGGGEPPASKFNDASLALLSLLLAFTFGMSLAKHDHRRDMVIADSTAIGDFYTCVSLLKDPVRTKLQNVIREYANLRVEVASTESNETTLESALQRFERMHSQMTDLVAEALRDGTPIAVSLTNTLDGVTSNYIARLAAVKDRLPASILLLLFVSALVPALLEGRQQGAEARTDVTGTLCFILVVILSVYVTLDLNQPQRGLVTVSQEPMTRVLSSMTK